MDHQGQEILLDDEPRFAGGAEISLAYAHLSLVFDKALRAYSLTCDDEDGEAVRLILEPSELEQIAREFLAAREWSRHAASLSLPSRFATSRWNQPRAQPDPVDSVARAASLSDHVVPVVA